MLAKNCASLGVHTRRFSPTSVEFKVEISDALQPTLSDQRTISLYNIYCAGAPRRPASVPSFRCTFPLDMPSSTSPGRSKSVASSSPISTQAFAKIRAARLSQLSCHPLQAGRVFEVPWFAFRYDLSSCSPRLTDLTEISLSHRGFYVQAFHESVSLPAAGYHYDSHWSVLSVGLSPIGNGSYPRCTGSARAGLPYADPTSDVWRRNSDWDKDEGC